MKPRLSTRLTTEDVDIWALVELRSHAGPGSLFETSAMHADRDCADLMLEAQQNLHKVLIGSLIDPPWKWVRVRGGVSFGDFLRETLT